MTSFRLFLAATSVFSSRQTGGRGEVGLILSYIDIRVHTHTHEIQQDWGWHRDWGRGKRKERQEGLERKKERQNKCRDYKTM